MRSAERYGTRDVQFGERGPLTIGHHGTVTPAELMWRDLALLGPASAVVVVLPLASLLAVVLGRKLALVPLVLTALLGTGWYLYYEREWPNPGLAGAMLAFATVLSGWALLGLALIWRPKDRADLRT